MLISQCLDIANQTSAWYNEDTGSSDNSKKEWVIFHDEFPSLGQGELY